MAKEHYLITRLKNLRPVFNAIFSRTATTKQVLPVMNKSIAVIVREAQALQAGIHHLEEGYFDSQALSNEFAHLTQFAISLPETIEGDGGFWTYALALVDRKVFREGAEAIDMEKLQAFRKDLDEIISIKQQIRDEAS